MRQRRATTPTAAPTTRPTRSGSLEAELTWWDTSDATNEAPAYDALIEKFNEEYPDVTINHETVPFDQTAEQVQDRSRVRLRRARHPARRGRLDPRVRLPGLPLRPRRHRAPLENNFLETPLSSNVYDGKTYGVPQVTDTLGLMYNKALFEKAGLDPEAPPTTWDEVREAAEALKGKAKVDGIYINSGGYFLLPFIYGEGADLVDTDDETITVNSSEAVTGIETAPGPGQGRHRREAGRQRPLRHDDDPLQGAARSR